jgi:hypothetical protein
MTTIERTRADVTVDLDFYDPTIAAPVDRFNDLVADLAAIIIAEAVLEAVFDLEA